MEENKEQELALKYINTTKTNLFLTGKAGTGKTTFLKKLAEKSAKGEGKRLIILAPTGVAAINAGGMTIHSFFQLKPQIYVPGVKDENSYLNTNKIKIIHSLDLIIIDEISMVRADLLDAIDKRLRQYRERKDLPFGGVQLLMIGDLHQLPPVVRGQEEELLSKYYNTYYFFGSRALNQVGYVTIELKKIYRQSDQKFVNILNCIRENRITPDVINELNKRYIPNYVIKDDEDIIKLTTHNPEAEKTNLSKLEQIKKKGVKYEAKITGDFPSQMYPVEATIELKEGAQVMFTKNNRIKNYFNGKVGKIVSLADNEIKVKCNGDSEPIVVTPEKWENIKYKINESTKAIEEESVGAFIQMPLRLAWAVTIHKSQGLTFDKVVIDSYSSFTHGQVYVALSRCRTLEGIILSTPFNSTSVISDGTIRSFMNFVERNENYVQNNLPNMQKEYFREEVSSLFNFEKIVDYMHSLYGCSVEKAVAKSYQSLTEAIENLITTVEADIVQVSIRFKNEYNRLINESQDAANDPKIADRLCKASAYFIGKLTLEDFDKTLIKIKIDNKEAETHYNGICGRIIEMIKAKIVFLTEVKNNGFNIKKYVSMRTSMDIDSVESEISIRNEETTDNKEEIEENKSVHKATDKDSIYSQIEDVWDMQADEVSSRLQKKEIQSLVEKLKTFRKEQKCPDRFVLSNKEILAITILKPTQVELLAICIKSKSKRKLYGEEIVKIVKSEVSNKNKKENETPKKDISKLSLDEIFDLSKEKVLEYMSSFPNESVIDSLIEYRKEKAEGDLEFKVFNDWKLLAIATLMPTEKESLKKCRFSNEMIDEMGDDIIKIIK